MRRRTSLALVAGYLALAASGDDFNFLRVALPALAATSPAGGLPLDDPNTDFVESSTDIPQPPASDAPFLSGAVSDFPRSASAAAREPAALARLSEPHPVRLPLRC